MYYAHQKTIRKKSDAKTFDKYKHYTRTDRVLFDKGIIIATKSKGCYFDKYMIATKKERKWLDQITEKNREHACKNQFLSKQTSISTQIKPYIIPTS